MMSISTRVDEWKAIFIPPVLERSLESELCRRYSTAQVVSEDFMFHHLYKKLFPNPDHTIIRYR
jgi:hypothetical protein